MGHFQRSRAESEMRAAGTISGYVLCLFSMDMD
jgi:hypothetical protein